MKRAMFITAALLLAVQFAPADAAAPGDPLSPGASHRNDTGAPVFVLLTLAPDAEFTNTSGETFRVLTARQLREVADAVADPRVIAHEDAIGRLAARLAALDAALAAFDAERDRLQEDTP